MKDFKKLHIYDVRPFIEQTAKDDDTEYKFRTLNKKNKECQILSKKSFEKYCDNHDDVRVVGKIRKRQHRYKEYDSEEELVKEKKKKKIIGQVILDIPDKDEKKYDLKKDQHCHTYGYAYVGGSKFVRVVTINPFLIILPFLIAGLVACCLFFWPEDSPLPFNPITGTSITQKDKEPTATEELPNCDYLLFDETVVLNKENQSIKLCNLASNEGLWYISYQVYIDDEPLMDINDPEKVYDTGAISPGYQIDGSKDANLNLYSRLDAGTYKLTAKATQYTYDANAKGEHLKTSVGQNIITTLVVEK